MPDQPQKISQQQQYQLELKGKYERLFSTIDGKAVLEDILRSGHLDRSIFSSDPLEMARDAGRQEFALHIKWMSAPQPEPANQQTKAA